VDHTKSVAGHVMLNPYFCIRWYLWATYCILVHHVCEILTHYFSCSGGTGVDRTKKCVETRYVVLVFLHPVRSVGHIEWSIMSEAQNVDALFFMLEWVWVDRTKSTSRQVMLNLYFCIRWGLCVT
jgi:hypothetical protein